MIKTYLILFSIFITGCFLNLNKKGEVPYFLDYKNDVPSETQIIKITNPQDSIIFETDSSQFGNWQQQGKFKTPGKYCVTVTSLYKGGTSKSQNYIAVNGDEKRIEINIIFTHDSTGQKSGVTIHSY